MNKCLIIGIGNTLRGDDGIASLVLKHLHDTIVSDRIVEVTQLTIELAPTLAECKCVLFIDAALDLPPGQWKIGEVPTGVEAATPFGHELTPAELVQLTCALFRHCPAASLLRIGASEFDKPDSISDILSVNVAAYADCVSHWYQENFHEDENPVVAL